MGTEQQEAWAAHDTHIGQIQALDPETAYLMKKKLAHGDIAGAFVSINLFTLRSQLAHVDLGVPFAFRGWPMVTEKPHPLKANGTLP